MDNDERLRPRTGDDALPGDDATLEEWLRPLSATVRPSWCPPERNLGNGYNFRRGSREKRHRDIQRQAEREKAAEAARLERARAGLDKCPDCDGWKSAKHKRCRSCTASVNSRKESREVKSARIRAARKRHQLAELAKGPPKRTPVDDMLDEVFATVMARKGGD